MDLSAGVGYIIGKLSRTFLSFGSQFSITSLACALLVAVSFLILRRLARNRRVRISALVRALFPKRILHSPSHAADIGYFFFGIFLYGIIFGWAVLSFRHVSNLVIDSLIAVFGPVTPTTLPALVSSSMMTVVIFLAYELGYWVHHYLSHRVPFMWEFHKVHHQAEVLTPLTLFRVHPLDTVLYYNIAAVFMGVANGVMGYSFGETVYQFSIADSNLILIVFVHLYVHLQHTHLWISFQGIFGRIFMSPAHHQIHHSANPVHFDKNLGSCLAVWDWVFGTLHVPSKEREKLSFGVEEAGGPHDVHGVHEALFAPVYRALLHFKPKLRNTAVQPEAGVNHRPL